MGHADLVDVRETHGKTDVHIFRVLDAHVHLAADVAGRLLASFLIVFPYIFVSIA